MTRIQAVRSKWSGDPKGMMAAWNVTRGRQAKPCIVCGSKLVLPVLRLGPWLVHCNHCGSEIPIAVMLNRQAWRITERIK